MKWIGILLLSLCILWIGKLQIERLHRRLFQCKGVVGFIRHIRGQISQFRMPLREIWSNYNEQIDGGSFDLLLVEKGLSEALAEAGDRLDIPSLLLQRLCDLNEKLGKDDAQEQISFCDYILSQAVQIYGEEQTRISERIRLTRILTVCAALMAVIIFL